MINLLYQFLERSAAQFPTKAAIRTNMQEVTFAQLNERSNNVRDYLQVNNVRRGDRVAILLGNTAETAIAFWGILKAGAVAVPLGAELKADKITYILNDCHSEILFSKMELLESSGVDLRASTPLRKVILTDNPDNVVFGDFYEQAEFVIHSKHNCPDEKEPVSLDLSSIIYTSGSTGEPKGVMLTHQNMVTATNSLNTYLGYNDTDKVLCALPLTFDYGLYQMIMSVSTGATLLLEKEFTWPIFLLKTIAQQGATIFPIVPTMLMMVYEQARKKSIDLSSIRVITNTGAALTLDNIRMSQELFPEAQIFSMYGLTECKRCTYLPPAEIDSKPGSVGIAIPNTELWLIDDDGNRITEPNVVGQLVIRGGTVMRGYWNKPEKTAEKLKEGTFPGEKILHTGDYCTLDEDGYLYFKGRMDSVIKSRGIKVSPREVEDFIHAFSEVHSCGVVGVPHDKYGEAIFAFVTLNDGNALTENEVFERCKTGLEAYKVPELVQVISEIPRTPNGKFNYLELKRRAMEVSSPEPIVKEEVHG